MNTDLIRQRLEGFNTAQLRRLASKLSIRRHSYMAKDRLVDTILHTFEAKLARAQKWGRDATHEIETLLDRAG